MTAEKITYPSLSIKEHDDMKQVYELLKYSLYKIQSKPTTLENSNNIDISKIKPTDLICRNINEFLAVNSIRTMKDIEKTHRTNELIKTCSKTTLSFIDKLKHKK